MVGAQKYEKNPIPPRKIRKKGEEGEEGAAPKAQPTEKEGGGGERRRRGKKKAKGEKEGGEGAAYGEGWAKESCKILLKFFKSG